MTTGRPVEPILKHFLNTTYRGDRHRKRAEQVLTNRVPLEKPQGLPRLESSIWDAEIAPAVWLDCHYQAAAIILCHLKAEFRRDPSRFSVRRHREMSAYAGVLGLK
jgi:hypothetical protein